jgi:cytochrome c oxidase subunit 2
LITAAGGVRGGKPAVSAARRFTGTGLTAAIPVLLTACEGPLSALDTAGGNASAIARLFWWMLAGAIAVWLFVMAAAAYAVRAAPSAGRERGGRRLIVFGGVVLPLVLLSGLLYAGLRQLPHMTAPGDGLTVRVTGERWWWRVRYEPRDGPTVITANEIRLPAGERVDFLLEASDVIHSFWIPSLGGKTDMIPGRLNRLVLDASEVGEYRGVCAEFCGLSHALMEFDVVVMEPSAFDDWLLQQAGDAEPPASGSASRGLALFLANGCGACHNISGTAANGRVGPDLTHVGSRRTIAAGTLPAGTAEFAHWIGHSTDIKAGVLMPAYTMLTDEERRAIGVYLNGLR